MTEKKCLACGGTNLVPYSPCKVLTCGEIGFDYLTESFACVNCGHIEFYAIQSKLDKQLEHNKKEEERKKLAAEYDKQIEAKKAELEKLRSIIADENQTVKAVKEAENKIVDVENEIRGLKSRKERETCHRPFMY
ncbi:MAG: hypothetical protein RBR71_11410 [Gudongella sp.]|nr:hypothetical protein [Gudongella sp.]